MMYTIVALCGIAVLVSAGVRPGRVQERTGTDIDSDFQCVDDSDVRVACLRLPFTFDGTVNDGTFCVEGETLNIRTDDAEPDEPDIDIGCDGNGRSDVKFLVPFRYVRRDDEITKPIGYECGPEVRLKVDGQVVAHTKAHYEEGGQRYPRHGEGYFKVKVSVANGVTHKVTLEFRDGESCDVYDDDDDAEKRTWARAGGSVSELRNTTGDANVDNFAPTCLLASTKKRSVDEQESSSSSSSSSSSGTTISLSEVREQQRIQCVVLDDAIRIQVDDSSSDDDDDSSSSSSSS
jgi:hypothetical protein